MEFNIFGRSAEIAHQYLKKCSKVLLVGRLIYETWTETDEKSRTKYSLRVETMKIFKLIVKYCLYNLKTLRTK